MCEAPSTWKIRTKNAPGEDTFTITPKPPAIEKKRKKRKKRRQREILN